jgi:hypothetical protein
VIAAYLRDVYSAARPLGLDADVSVHALALRAAGRTPQRLLPESEDVAAAVAVLDVALQGMGALHVDSPNTHGVSALAALAGCTPTPHAMAAARLLLQAGASADAPVGPNPLGRASLDARPLPHLLGRTPAMLAASEWAAASTSAEGRDRRPQTGTAGTVDRGAMLHLLACHGAEMWRLPTYEGVPVGARGGGVVLHPPGVILVRRARPGTQAEVAALLRRLTAAAAWARRAAMVALRSALLEE